MYKIKVLLNCIRCLKNSSKVMCSRLNCFHNRVVVCLQTNRMVAGGGKSTEGAIRDFLESVQMAIVEKITMLVIL